MGKNTICVHEGGIVEPAYKGVNTPIYPSTSYGYLDTTDRLYPRYFNLPNQTVLGKKLAALEHAEAGCVFSSGMAAITSTLFSFLKKGDHAIFQKGLYGGTTHFVQTEFQNFGIQYDFTRDLSIESFMELVKPNTKVIYVETPSNPLLNIVDLRAVAKLGREKKIITIIDNTFATPINQLPIDLGIDIAVHSASKYIGGHSDLLAGFVVTSSELLEPIILTAKNFGGAVNPQTCYLLERSLKTLNLRVTQQCKNAHEIAKFLTEEPYIQKVNYPGLHSHPDHEVAKSQMSAFGAVVSFELLNGLDPLQFQKQLELILASGSLGGMETTIVSSYLTSHSALPEYQQLEEGINKQLMRLSVGIEEVEDLINDIKTAFTRIKTHKTPALSTVLA